VLLRALAHVMLVAVLGGSMAACTDDEEPVRQVEVNPTQIDEFVATSVSVQREAFCDRVADDAVTAAVGEVGSTRQHDSGERVRIVPGVRDRVHEYGCTYTGTGGDVARAWVLAPPVTRAQARALVVGVRRTAGCRVLDGHDFGSPATGALCTTRGRAEASYRGLFGDAWLTCSVTDGGRTKLSREQLLRKAGDWCVQLATAAAG